MQDIAHPFTGGGVSFHHGGVHAVEVELREGAAGAFRGGWRGLRCGGYAEGFQAVESGVEVHCCSSVKNSYAQGSFLR